MPPPRIDLGLDSPMTQRIASSRFDLPQPLGPTAPVSPGSMRSSVGSTKLLKPVRRSRFLCTMSPHADHTIAGCVTSARSDEHPSELLSLMRISYSVFCFEKITNPDNQPIMPISH